MSTGTPLEDRDSAMEASPGDTTNEDFVVLSSTGIAANHDFLPSANKATTTTTAGAHQRSGLPLDGSTSGVTVTPAGVTIISPSVPPSSSLNPRSCRICRQRKVKCDRHMPCSNCVKVQSQCCYPPPGRAPRRTRPKQPKEPKNSNASTAESSPREIELMQRLRKLEDVVEELSTQIDVDYRHHSSPGESPEDATDHSHDQDTRQHQRDYLAHIQNGSQRGSAASTGRAGLSPGSPNSSELNQNFGRFVLKDNGNTRYVSSALWSRVRDELAHLRLKTQEYNDDDSDDTEDEDLNGGLMADAAVPPDYDHHAFVLGYRSSEVDLRHLHPPSSQIGLMWQIYAKNVDPISKILHRPQMEKLISQAQNDLGNISPGLEALLFSVYFAVTTSLEPEDVRKHFNTERDYLLRKYRFAAEQALAKANFLTTSELVVVQAFALLLITVKLSDESRFSWSLTGLLIRICQSLGIHREGTYFSNLSPFETEMRRRLWWMICMLDLRAAEDQGSELTVGDWSHDTRIPLNINDDDISPESIDFPPERTGVTDMAFVCIRFEIFRLVRRIYPREIPNTLEKVNKETLRYRADMVEGATKLIHEKYMVPSKDDNLLSWCGSMVARLLLAKVTLILHQALLTSEDSEVNAEVRDRLFNASVEAIEMTHELKVNPRSRPFRWLINTYAQCTATAFLLLEICSNPWCGSSERGWNALNKVDFPDLNGAPSLSESRHLWIPMSKLMRKAKKHREAELKRLQNDPDAMKWHDSVVGRETSALNETDLRRTVRPTVTRDRWREILSLPISQDSPQTSLGGQPATPADPPLLSTRASSSTRLPLSASAMEYLDEAMAQPTFNPSNFWGIAFSADAAKQMMDSTGHGIGSYIEPPKQTSLDSISVSKASDVTTTRGPLASVGPPSAATSQSVPTPTGTASTISSEIRKNPPPWAWSDPLGTGSNNSLAEPTPPIENVDHNMEDHNMEEDFDWHNWQQIIRGFDMEDGFGIGMAGLGNGFSSMYEI